MVRLLPTFTRLQVEGGKEGGSRVFPKTCSPSPSAHFSKMDAAKAF